MGIEERKKKGNPKTGITSPRAKKSQPQLTEVAPFSEVGLYEESEKLTPVMDLEKGTIYYELLHTQYPLL